MDLLVHKKIVKILNHIFLQKTFIFCFFEFFSTNQRFGKVFVRSTCTHSSISLHPTIVYSEKEKRVQQIWSIQEGNTCILTPEKSFVFNSKILKSYACLISTPFIWKNTFELSKFFANLFYFVFVAKSEWRIAKPLYGIQKNIKSFVLNKIFEKDQKIASTL